jgi:hypothetical protein
MNHARIASEPQAHIHVQIVFCKFYSIQSSNPVKKSIGLIP